MRHGLAALRCHSVKLLLSVLLLSGLVACEPSDPTPIGRGRGIFQRTCSGCHGRDGRGTMRPGLSRPPRDLTNPEFQAQMSDAQLRQSIRVGKGQMPAFGGLMGEEDISNVIAYVRSLVPPGTVPPAAGGAAPGAAAAPAATPGAAAPGAAAPAAPPSASVSPGAAVPAAERGALPGAAGAAAVTEPAAITARGANTP